MEQDTNVHLQWNNHQTTLLSVFSSLLGKENLVDCTICADGQYFKAHRVILSACSPYFELLFSKHCETHPIVILPDVKFQILKALMEFMYYGEVKVPQDKLHIVLKLADTLQIKGLSSAGDSELKGNLKPKRKNAFSTFCDQQGFKKHRHEHRYDSQVKQKEGTFSLHTSEKERSEHIDPYLPAARNCDKYSSNSVYPEKTDDEAATFQDISVTEAFNMLQCSSITKPLTKSNTRVSGTLLNSVSSVLDSSQLLELCKVKDGEQRILSENVTSTRLTSEELRTSAPVGVCCERPATDLVPQIKQEDPHNFKSDSIEEIILDNDIDEDNNPNHDHGSGADNSNIVRGLTTVVLEQSISGQGFCTQEQFRDPHSVEPASLFPKQFKCNTCGRSYQYGSSLLRHLKYECGKEPQFKCPHCHARFFHNYDLKVHISMIHKVQ